MTAPDDFATRLAALTITATSPDRRVQAVAQGPGGELTVSFTSPYHFEDYQDDRSLGATLAEQVQAAVNKAAQGTAEGRRRVIERYSALANAGPSGDATRRALHEAQEKLVAEGRSPKGNAMVATQGLLRWKVALGPSALRLPDGDAFCAEVNTALTLARASYSLALRRLKTAHLAPGGSIGHMA